MCHFNTLQPSKAMGILLFPWPLLLPASLFWKFLIIRYLKCRVLILHFLILCRAYLFLRRLYIIGLAFFLCNLRVIRRKHAFEGPGRAQKIRSEKWSPKIRNLSNSLISPPNDLNEPLRTVTSLVGLLSEKYSNALDETAKKSFNFITEAVYRMNQLIKGLLDYGRLGQDAELKE